MPRRRKVFEGEYKRYNNKEWSFEIDGVVYNSIAEIPKELKQPSCGIIFQLNKWENGAPKVHSRTHEHRARYPRNIPELEKFKTSQAV